MLSNRMTRIALLLPAILYPALAHAHVGVGETSGFAHGFAHPLSGLDHMLAMILVGVLAFQIGGRALWLVPLAFVGMMAIGGALGGFGVNVPFVEVGIAMSVIALGAAVALEIRTPAAIAAGLVGLFAIFHGHAHGAEMPENVTTLTYAAGFTLATALLHVTGIGLGFGIGTISRRIGPSVVRFVGGIAALVGLGILSSAL
ncbi:HupE/UreJ family protein [Phyllobacterium lublinensis]|uniref:HupE/UreJ family protein n=1 Tax=Phyllobacterium lublinensis TaxID=2875708 RepID=UPI001CCED3A4|nr:HupE/UreJ family protein [Phyllobacterium sp. 2063]MBZ9655735.1 HupE/UreJ family protein [Phyllobacterium sp. 2063]